jgi:hypothetical protein
MSDEVDYRAMVGKLLKVTTHEGQEIIGTVYGYNCDLKLLVLTVDSKKDPKVKKIKIINMSNAKGTQRLDGEERKPEEIYSEINLLDVTKEDIFKQEEKNKDEWLGRQEELVDQPHIDFKGNFIKKHFAKQFRGSVKWDGDKISIYNGEAFIAPPYDEVTNVSIKKESDIAYYSKVLARCQETLNKTLEEFPSVKT